MNKRDLKLIYELDSNYRKKYSKIGKKVKMSQQLISYKINSFLEKGVIKRYYPLIDYSRLGYLNFIVFFKASYTSEQGFENLINRLTEHDDITTILERDGKYDLVLIIAAKNPSSFNKILRKLISDHPKELRDFMILTIVVEHHFLRDYLIGGGRIEETVIGGDREELSIDSMNKKIIRSLMRGKKRTMDLVKATKINSKTLISRIRWLEKNGVIKGYRLLLNPKLINISINNILIKYHDLSTEREDEFKKFCTINPNIVEFVKTIGEWDVMLTVETANRQEFRKLYLQIRERFEDIIQDFDIFRVFSVHKKQFLPEEAFE